ncbi:MAG: endonuclease III [Deltaproteobacteria bacterium]|nr:endonuclease III [Deltaproteobacteria bacterium]
MPPSPQETAQIVALLEEHYPSARTSLDFADPFQLLVSTVLSAQCTDERVNKVTPALFARFPDARALASADLAELEQLIRPTGFFRNKAKNLKAAAQMMVADFQGQVPDNLADLVKLPGVARKTANVVLGAAFNIPGVVVDTHVKRVAGRLGWTSSQNPEKIERQLMAIWPRESWTKLGFQVIIHGRSLCQARRPQCSRCFLKTLCDFGKKEIGR